MQPVTPEQREPLRAVPPAPVLTVLAVYRLSEAGRKASLLAGGDGKGVQRLSVVVPAMRMHLVAVDLHGRARLKLEPRFERRNGTVIRRDGPPSYDAPPTIEELFRDAARNHELEREFQSERSMSRHRRGDADRDRRQAMADEFLTAPGDRAMVHPAPTPRRCFIATAAGRVEFDAARDVGSARDLPAEAYRRFRADLRARKDGHLRVRSQHLALHEEKTRVIADWVARHGSDDQRARHAAGLLPAEEVIEALTDEAFSAVDDMPRYPREGAARLERHLRAVTGRANLVVAPADLQVVGAAATAATSAQWSVIRQLESRLPDAVVKLREHRLLWRREPSLPGLSVYGVRVTRQVGPFVLRREFAVPER
jgi:hypothetical protein